MDEDTFVGSIKMFAFNFAPVDFAFCNGQKLSIEENSALYSLIGTIYGGDGQKMFAIPDLRGKVPVHFGKGPQLSSWALGEKKGSRYADVEAKHMPVHNHNLQAVTSSANETAPNNTLLAESSLGVYNSNATAATYITMSSDAIQSKGGSQPHNNEMPYLAINFCIAKAGIYPSRP